jgi:hypothetical protein
MAYRIRYHLEVKVELDKLKATYKPTSLPRRFDRWLHELAAEAEAREWNLSLDLAALLERLDEAEQTVRHWPTVWQRFWNASFIDKLKAAAVVIAKWRPPYEPRAAVRVFSVYAEDCEVTVLYLVDHAAKEVVFLAVEGLPMQGYD